MEYVLKRTETGKKITVRMLQNKLLEMMKDIDKICQKNDINYFLAGGSCLGAVRHHGFIPWDDDMDIAMSRVEYNKFVKALKKDLGDKYVFHCYEKNKKYPVGSNNIMSTKIVVSRTNPVRASMILVKTKSPLIFKHRTKDGYEHCSVEEANFSEFAKDNINSELSMLNENVDNTIEIIPLKAHKVYDKIFDMTFPASVGTFILKARPDTLTKLLRYGIGGRRGEGYGMIELITEVRDE